MLGDLNRLATRLRDVTALNRQIELVWKDATRDVPNEHDLENVRRVYIAALRTGVNSGAHIAEA